MHNFQKLLIPLSLGMLCIAFNPKNETIEVEENPSVTQNYPVERPDNSGFDEPLDSNNGVKVTLNDQETLNWDRFRRQFHTATDDPEGFPQHVAVGPWITGENFDYRRVYRQENNAIWIQTYYRKAGMSPEIDPNANAEVLTLQVAETNGLGTVWNEMIEQGLFLTDSLSN